MPDFQESLSITMSRQAFPAWLKGWEVKAGVDMRILSPKQAIYHKCFTATDGGSVQDPSGACHTLCC